MTMVCKICSHPKRLEIDREIVQGGNLSKIARKYGLPYNSLYNHSQNHLSRQLVQAYEKKELAESLNLLNRIEDMLNKAEEIFNRNYEAKKDLTALKALGEQRNTIELLAKIAAYLHETRALELQSKQEDYETRREREEQEFVSKALDRLNPSEADIWEKLIEKIHGLTDEEIIPFEEKRWTEGEPSETQEEDLTQKEDNKTEAEPDPVEEKQTERKSFVRTIPPKKIEPYSTSPIGTGNWIARSSRGDAKDL